MKFIAVILSVYVLVLTSAPCADECISISETDGISFSQGQVENSNSSAEADLCSPFCFCNCCQFLSLPEYSNFSLITTPLQSVEIAFIANFFASPVIGFWRPPKLV